MLTHAFSLRIWEAGGSVRSQGLFEETMLQNKTKKELGLCLNDLKKKEKKLA